MNDTKIRISLVLLFIYLFSASVAASSNGGSSERQSLLTIDDDNYAVLSVERLGHFTHYRFTNRISIKHYSLKNNVLINTDVLMESQIDSSAKAPPDPLKVTNTGTELTTLQNVFGGRAGGFEGYIRRPKYRIKAGTDGLFMNKNGKRSILITADQLRLRIPNFLKLIEYNAIEVVGIQGSAYSHYFLLVRSNEWGSDVGSFEQILAIPN